MLWNRIEALQASLDKLPEEIRKHVQNSFSVGTNPGDMRFFVNAQPTTLDLARQSDVRMSDAEKLSLVRRFYMDLYGLPPTQQQLGDFFSKLPKASADGVSTQQIAPFTAGQQFPIKKNTRIMMHQTDCHFPHRGKGMVKKIRTQGQSRNTYFFQTIQIRNRFL